MPTNKKRFVLVATSYRGVFAGWLEREQLKVVGGTECHVVELSECQMIVHWSAETKGILGLAASGPGIGSRVGPACPRAKLFGVTAIFDVADEAREKIQRAPWS